MNVEIDVKMTEQQIDFFAKKIMSNMLNSFKEMLEFEGHVRKAMEITRELDEFNFATNNVKIKIVFLHN